MLASVSNWFSRTSTPQRRKQRTNGFSFDTYEDRTLLSGVAIYPQPAAAVATEDVTPAADPPGDFAGTWDITSSIGGGTAQIQQEGNKLEIQFVGGDFDDDAHGKVKGNNAKAKFKISFEGGNLKGKINASLESPTDMSGTVTGKVPGLGKQTVSFTGTRMIS